MTSKRRSAGVMLAAVTAGATLTGCGQLINPYTTELQYDPADGVSARVGDLQASDLLIVNDGEGSEGKLSGLVYNAGSSDSQLTITVNGADTQVTIPANSSVRLDGKKNGNGDKTVSPVTISSLGDAKVGEQISATLKTSPGGSTQVAIPVLLDQYPYGDAKVEHPEAETSGNESHGSGH